ncbi:hypothetical protein CC1G_03187 [Coprinopsis cinerea okayama7|uniref:DUF6533 domain-containing protein n=1 Tax=Coprinopsis cinerea (strain Okayama-7 / 130 / ATCC MYA-4618 / FGSC 9003) TaxID=240176 RepID=A8PF88_COPC7|nr:hypothetical protein CC1G_03187 [Coprinopsis cinerea okayama7\|eukprot:XP_001840958.1 hypothetical protein CC1G_03187 [Coprinopsis cinerea okayama7\
MSTKYFTIIASTAYICDYLETVKLEVKYMWNGLWNLARVLFFISRYIALLQIPLFIHFIYERYMDPMGCYVLQASILTSSFVGEACPLALLILCLYALFGAKRKYAPLFAFGYFLLVAFRFTTLAVVLPNMIANAWPYAPFRCSLSTRVIGVKFIQANRILKIVGQAILLALTCYIGYKRSKVTKSPLLMTMWRGGVQYFAGICFMTILDLIAHYLRPKWGYLSIVNYLLRISLPILANRLLLQMYKRARMYDVGQTTPTISGLRFADRFPEISDDDSLVSSDFSDSDGFGGTGRLGDGEELEMARRGEKVEGDGRL